jgi:glyoxylase-like metal-dependent hydrolase (beta-lactamase superfamily II)
VTFEQVSARVYRYRDLCNVYVVTSGERALLIDLGSGQVLDQLEAIGIRSVDWVLHTHHHRDQCQGDGRLRQDTRIAVPAREAALFEDAEAMWQHRKVYDLYDLAGVFNSPAYSVPVARRMEDYSTLDWEGITFSAEPTPGHTRGALTYWATIDGLRYAFCGDLIYASGRVWTLHDLQWNYNNPDALNAAIYSAYLVRQKRPDRLAPSHGTLLDNPTSALLALETNLRALHARCNERFLNDWEPPLAVEHRLRRVTEHLVQVTQSCANFYALTSWDGDVLFFDYGFPSAEHLTGAECRFVEHSLVELREQCGIDGVSTLIPTHYHDDHVAGVPYLQRRFGTQVWAFEAFADILARPHAYRIPCLWREPIHVDRVLRDGETFTWHEYTFVARHNPGHTWYAVMLLTEIDGRRIAITGDEIQLNRQGNLRGGGPVYRNRLGGTSFTRSLEAVLDFQPELLLTGHDGALEVSRADLEAVYAWCRGLEASFRALAPTAEEVDAALDPDIISIYPYQLDGIPGEPISFNIAVRNHDNHAQEALLTPVVPTGWHVMPPSQTVRLLPHAEAQVPFAVTPPDTAAAGMRHVMTVEAVLGERQLGQATEGLVVLQRRRSSPQPNP